MSTNHESQSFSIENNKEIRHAARLDKVYFMTNMVGAGLIAGTTIGIVLDIALGSTTAIGTGTILGAIIGGLIGTIFLWIKRHRSDVKLPATAQDSDAEPPQSA